MARYINPDDVEYLFKYQPKIWPTPDEEPKSSDQTAKADAGKLKPSLVEPELIEVAAKLEEYDLDVAKGEKPKMICKTLKVGHDWKALFECPFCGKLFEAYISNIVSGRQRSCGCAKGKLSIAAKGTHGDAKKRLYRIYRHILDRCESPSCKEYKWYGARGIKCEFKSYEDFKEFAMSHGYRDDLTVERIDVNGNYSPDNVTFIPQQLQNRNTRRNVMITYNGLTLCASEWGEILGLNGDTITSRKRKGWNDEDCLKPVNGSVDISLVPIGIIQAVREVRRFGVTKYKDPDNWKMLKGKGMSMPLAGTGWSISRTIQARMRNPACRISGVALQIWLFCVKWKRGTYEILIR